jgi:hypothetical protein
VATSARNIPFLTADKRIMCRYDPDEHACWHSGPVPYAHIANTLAALDSTTKRLRIADALTNMFRAVMQHSPEDLESTVYLTLGKIAPDYEGGELNIGGSTVSSAITDVTGAVLGSTSTWPQPALCQKKSSSIESTRLLAWFSECFLLLWVASRRAAALVCRVHHQGGLRAVCRAGDLRLM